MKKRIILVFLLSLAVQAGFYSYKNFPVEKDAVFYDTVSMNLAKGNGFVSQIGMPALNVKQGYALFLAFIYLIFGHNIALIKFIQMFFVAGTSVFVYLIGRRAFSEKVGFSAAIFLDFYPPMVILSGILLSEAMFSFLIAAYVFLFMIAIEKDSFKYYLWGAAALALSIQARPTTFLYPVLFLFILMLLYKNKQRAFKIGLMVICASLLLMIPWGIRNYRCFGHFWLIESVDAAWLSTYVKGGADQDNADVKWEVAGMAERKRLRTTGAIREEYIKMATANIKSDLPGYIMLAPNKIRRLWIGTYSGLFNIGIPYSGFFNGQKNLWSNFRVFLFKTLMLTLSSLIFILGLLGMFLGLRDWQNNIMVYSLPIYFTVFYVLLFSNNRFGIPAVPYMVLFAVFAIDNLRKILIERTR